jgi:hypothetical protein
MKVFGRPYPNSQALSLLVEWFFQTQNTENLLVFLIRIRY